MTSAGRFRTRGLLCGLVLAGLAGLAGCGGGSSASPDAGADAPMAVIYTSGKHMVEIGKTIALTASTVGGTDTTYFWHSEDEAVVTVDETGLVTGVAAGEVSITVTGKNSIATAAHAVVVLPRSVVGTPSVNVTGDFVLLLNKQQKLVAVTSNGTDSSYTWTSSDPNVATVAADGTVRGLVVGRVTIAAEGVDTKARGEIGMVVSSDVPNQAAWALSGHANVNATAFNYWNTTVPPEVPSICAKCHSAPGFRDFIGDDGSAVNAVNENHPIGTVVDCNTCHNATAQKLTSVLFPSGVTVNGLGPEARCMTCHQGRESTDSVDSFIAAVAAADDDTVSGKLGFKNIHYFAAGATLSGGKVRGGYQYTGKVYDWRFRHAPGYDACVNCHDPHSLKVKVGSCATCHAGVAKVEDLRGIRMNSSIVNDYDGDGDITEGLYDELGGLRTKLHAAILSYAATKAGDKICYSADAYPYFFKDTNGDGACDATEAVAANKYVSWTNRLLRGAYNYQVSLKDPGAFAHNGKYVIELLFDSIEDINKALDTKVDLSKAVRNDSGHFNGAGQAARHWDKEAVVPGTCSKCHDGAEGLRSFLKYGGGGPGEHANGLDCATCHDAFGTKPTDYVPMSLASVTFPGGVVVKPDAATNGKSLVCITCHSGRESKSTVDAAIAAAAPGKLTFVNVHYLPAGATLYGGVAHVGYEYAGRAYALRRQHSGGTDCASCHSARVTKHTFQVKDNVAVCKTCHTTITTVDEIRPTLKADYDGDGKCAKSPCVLGETLAGEIQGLAERLLAQMNVAAGAAKLCYSGADYPYFFADTNGDGTCSATEKVFANAYAAWTGPLVRAAHNYQISQKEPGAWAHNFPYVAELLIDSVENLGGNISALTRP